jgi:dihydroorotase
MRIIDENGKIRDSARRAWESGVIMDIGHGAGSFSFETAEALLTAGYRPDVISSDIHQLSIHGPMFDLPTCLSKFMSLGMSFAEVVRAATLRPAEVLGLQAEIGTLRPGAYADIALFQIVQGAFPFYDIHMEMRAGRALIRNTLTIVGGRSLLRQPPDPPAPWIDLLESQRELIARGHLPELMERRQASGSSA